MDHDYDHITGRCRKCGATEDHFHIVPCVVKQTWPRKLDEHELEFQRMADEGCPHHD